LKPPQALEEAPPLPTKPAAKQASKKKAPSATKQTPSSSTIDESFHAPSIFHSSMPPPPPPPSSSVMFLRAAAQKAMDIVPDTPSRTSVASFRYDLLDRDEDIDEVRPETQSSNTRTYFNTL
jgi:hypothetical protein